MPKPAPIRMHPKDDLIVALGDLECGEDVAVGEETFRLLDAVPAKHPFAARDLAVGESVSMYGVVVGETLQPVRRGGRLHPGNLKHASATFSGKQEKSGWQAPGANRWKKASFRGYYRSDGSVGTANYWLVVPLVFCENRNLAAMREALLKPLGYQKTGAYQELASRLVSMCRAGKTPDEILAVVAEAGEEAGEERLFPHVDGVKFLYHEGGCGGARQDSQALCGLLAGYITHPNVFGATVLSLGCQHAQVSILMEEIEKRSPGFSKPLLVFEQQQSRSEKSLLSAAIKQTFTGLMAANRAEREPAALSHLTIGVECGASDGFSGISANPAIGHAVDLAVACGGSAILSEFPELCGVEQELMNRCTRPEAAHRFAELLREYAARAKAVGSGFDMNPSPGNIQEGLITDAIKSAGAARKGGTSPVVEVLDYPEKIRQQGLNLLCTPGNDVESTTALVGAGANLVLFSTGLGTPTGNPIAPVIKVSSNTEVYEKTPGLDRFRRRPDYPRRGHHQRCRRETPGFMRQGRQRRNYHPGRPVGAG